MTIGRLALLLACLALLLVPVPNVVLTWVFPVWVAMMSLTLLTRRGVVSDALRPTSS